MADYLAIIGARAQQWAVAFTFMDPAAKVECLCLLSFAVCILGSLAEFPLEVNLAIAVLGLSSSRSGSEAQLLGVCFFAVLSTITDIIFMCTKPSGYGGFITMLNLALKLAAATQSYRLCETGQRISQEELPPDPIGGGYQGPTEHLAALTDDCALHETKSDCKDRAPCCDWDRTDKACASTGDCDACEDSAMWFAKKQKARPG